MIYKDVSFKSPEDNLFYDEALLVCSEKKNPREILRFWESDEYFIVLGRTGKAEEDLNIDKVKKDGVPIFRRCSGGGTVLQGKGCLNYSLVLSKDKTPALADITGSYKIILGKVVEALNVIGEKVLFLPISDIALEGEKRKISGNAQKRGKQFILHHGTILYDLDKNLVEKYLRIPQVVPLYRQGRKHMQFMDNIQSSVSDIKESMKKIFIIENEEGYMTQEEHECLQQLKGARTFSVRV